MSDVCIRCAARGTSCCVSREGVAGPPLTEGDIARIEAASGLERDAFVTERDVDEIEQAAWEEDDPATRGLVRLGRVRSLARRGDGCLFLGERGCTLGAARPLLCHRFPFVRLGRRIEVRPGGSCLAAEEAEGLEELLGMFGQTRAGLRSLDAALRQELRGAAE